MTNAKILLLEEDAVFGAYLRSGLVELGCDVVLIRNGSEGLARAVTDRFDLVLLSAELPGVNGFRICNRIKKDETARATPIFLMSVDAAAMAQHRQLATRAEEYFAKPVSLDELTARMRAVLEPKDRTELGSALDEARDRLVALVELETRLAEQERTIASLRRELAGARAASTAPPATPRKPPPVPRPSGQMPIVRPDAPAEGGGSVDADATSDQGSEARRIARLQKQLAAAHADRELAGKRARDAAVGAEAMRSELAAARAEWEAERQKLERLAAVARETAEASAAALAAEREQLAEECASLRARIEDVETARKVARQISEEKSLAAARARTEASELRAAMARTKREADELVATARSEAAELRKRLAEELDLASEQAHRRATDEIAEVVARAGDLVRAMNAKIEELEAERDRRIAEREANWMKYLDDVEEAHASEGAAAREAKLAEEAAERQALERDFHARFAGAEARTRSLTAELAAEVAAHEKTRAAHAIEKTYLTARIDALEALAATRTEDLAQLERELEEARLELPQLEAEIIVLRGELVNVRRQLDLQELSLRAATSQLEQDREIVERARKVLEGPDSDVA